MAVTLTLLSRDYCHLCDDMLAALRTLQSARGFRLEVVDIDAHPPLEHRYGELVPVLLAGERQICHYFLDPAALDAALADLR